MSENNPVPYIIWNDSLSVGSPYIDAQHRGLLELINSLYTGLTKKVAVSLPRILDELNAYTEEHFTAEERMFGNSAYPDYEAHVQAHRHMIRKMAELRIQYRSGDKDISLETLAFLKKWWVGHIMKMDQQYAPFLAENGTEKGMADNAACDATESISPQGA